jgi:hypothetical protein
VVGVAGLVDAGQPPTGRLALTCHVINLLARDNKV